MRYPQTAISEVANFNNGFPFKPSDWCSTGYKIIRIQNLSDHSKPFNRTQKEVPARYLVKRGDILVSWSATIDVFEWDDEDAYLNQHIFKVDYNPHKVDKQYFKLSLKNTVRELGKFAHGSTMKHVVKGDFDNHQIPLPPLDDQIRIATLLSKVENLISRRREQLKQLDELLKSVFLDMFGDPVRNKKSWEIKRMDDISDSRLGKMRDKKFITGNHLRRYIGNSNVQWFRFKLDDLEEMDFDERERALFALMDGDLLICEGGDIGRCAIWRNNLKECFFQKAIHRVRLHKSRAIPEYVQYVMLLFSLYNGFKNVTCKATISHLTGEKLKETLIPLPPLELQNHFAATVNKVKSAKDNYIKSLTNLDFLYETISQKAFKGELDLSRVPLVEEGKPVSKMAALKDF
ncbi:MAG: restriction endonuclease subunit S [Chlorobium sp.]|jgi:type I restriction enzyme S subunit|nr:restriction endonuclease subunit S [Chlorobium sp.]